MLFTTPNEFSFSLCIHKHRAHIHIHVYIHIHMYIHTSSKDSHRLGGFEGFFFFNIHLSLFYVLFIPQDFLLYILKDLKLFI